MTGKITKNLTQEDKDLLGEAWFIAELCSNRTGEDVHDWVNRAINVLFHLEGKVSHIFQKVNSKEINQMSVPLIEESPVADLGTYIIVQNVRYDVTASIVTKWRESILERGGPSLSQKEAITEIEIRRDMDKVIYNQKNSPDDAMSFLMFDIIKRPPTKKGWLFDR